MKFRNNIATCIAGGHLAMSEDKQVAYPNVAKGTSVMMHPEKKS